MRHFLSLPLPRDPPAWASLGGELHGYFREPSTSVTWLSRAALCRRCPQEESISGAVGITVSTSSYLAPAVCQTRCSGTVVQRKEADGQQGPLKSPGIPQLI